MTTPTLFTYADTPVRVLDVDGEPWFVLADLCKVLDLSNPSMVAQRLDADALSTAEVIDGMGRAQSARTVTEAGMYEAVFMSRKPEARDFKRWVTHEVLPTIRKTGSYQQPKTLAERSVELIQDLHAEVAALTPRASAWDTMAGAHGDYAVDEAAKILSRDPNITVGRARLFTHMAERGWIYRHGARNRWHAYQSQVDNGRLVQRMSAAFLNQRTGEMEVPDPTIRITVKGLEALRASLTPALELSA
ncbi:phage antirepressor [Galactobacter caseinivorans]|uniref:Bro-N domain-containing protein n=1 Tax=Galactobacter caseinivorans TaxID=2676123 RepID=A0A496PMU6_9MICC|nr:phage antirepressor [Galactobacter caseinivorans]RKW71786.1 hypothetical protein DWQ67_02860 [Galactobacter caseinivorans]